MMAASTSSGAAVVGAVWLGSALMGPALDTEFIGTALIGTARMGGVHNELKLYEMDAIILWTKTSFS